MAQLAYLHNYPEHIVAQVQQLLDQDKPSTLGATASATSGRCTTMPWS